MVLNIFFLIWWFFYRFFKRDFDRIFCFSKFCFVFLKEFEVRKFLILFLKVMELVVILFEKIIFIIFVRNFVWWNINFLSLLECWYYSKIFVLWKKFNIVFVDLFLDWSNFMNIFIMFLFLELISFLMMLKVKNGWFLVILEFCRLL